MQQTQPINDKIITKTRGIVQMLLNFTDLLQLQTYLYYI